jgi:hypothetical protein
MDSRHLKLAVYLGALLSRSRLTWDHRVMVPVVRRQQLVTSAENELWLLANRGTADPRVSLHSIMHHVLSDLGRIVRDICCRGSHNRRRRITRSFPGRTCRLLRYL